MQIEIEKTPFIKAEEYWNCVLTKEGTYEERVEAFRSAQPTLSAFLSEIGHHGRPTEDWYLSSFARLTLTTFEQSYGSVPTVTYQQLQTALTVAKGIVADPAVLYSRREQELLKLAIDLFTEGTGRPDALLSQRRQILTKALAVVLALEMVTQPPITRSWTDVSSGSRTMQEAYA